jgi:hypothetical protein
VLIDGFFVRAFLCDLLQILGAGPRPRPPAATNGLDEVGHSIGLVVQVGNPQAIVLFYFFKKIICSANLSHFH